MRMGVARRGKLRQGVLRYGFKIKIRRGVLRPGRLGCGVARLGTARYGYLIGKDIRMATKEKTKKINADTVTNGGEATIVAQYPYTVHFTIQGASDLLFHRWNCEAVDEKATAAKGSAAKKTDNIESYLYRDDSGFVCLPGEYIRQSVIASAKYRQDPRSPRKSAMDLYKAALISLTPLASLGSKEYDYEDRRRVVVQRAGINRTRPAMKTGWKADFTFMVNLPEYIDPPTFYDVLAQAGRLVGVGDFRPTYGRFNIVKYDVKQDF